MQVELIFLTFQYSVWNWYILDRTQVLCSLSKKVFRNIENCYLLFVWNTRSSSTSSYLVIFHFLVTFQLILCSKGITPGLQLCNNFTSQLIF